MKKRIPLFIISVICIICFAGCRNSDKVPKIGVFLVAGSASRWKQEIIYMEDEAHKLGAQIDARLYDSGSGKTPAEQCFDLIDSGIDVLIIRLKDPADSAAIITHAQQNKVKVVCYANIIENHPIDMFIGYDCERIGAKMGQYIAELVPSGDYILLSGDPDDKSVSDNLYNGAMRYISVIRNSINIILDTSIPSWDPAAAKILVKDAIIKNGKTIDAILAPNDSIAGACAEVIAELQIKTPVIITGMDCQLDAVKRITAGTQSCTFYMDFHVLAQAAVKEAYNMAAGQKINANFDLDNGSGSPIPAYLITGQLITKENLNRILIDNGYMTKEEIYGTP